LSIITGLVYKFYNKKGILLVKADYAPYNNEENKKKLTPIYHFFYKKFMNRIDIILVEHEYGFKYFNNLSFLGKKTTVVKVNNGIDIIYNKLKVNYFEKKNTILYVGRVTVHEKRVDFLLKALQLIELKNWNVKIIGSIYEDIHDHINEMFISKPYLKQRVTFTGPIFEKDQLYKEFINAKVVCLVSVSEGAPLVISEALFFGCYFISTNSSPLISEIINDERMGKVTDVNSVSQFADALQEYINNEQKHEEYFNYIMNKREMFTWKNSINLIDETIKFKIKEKIL